MIPNKKKFRRDGVSYFSAVLHRAVSVIDHQHDKDKNLVSIFQI